ncbi:MAG: hypothetical protein ABIH42_02315 [Planctomycetota bacterium]
MENNKILEVTKMLESVVKNKINYSSEKTSERSWEQGTQHRPPFEQQEIEKFSTDSAIILKDYCFEFHYDETVFKQLATLPKPPDLPIEEDENL